MTAERRVEERFAEARARLRTISTTGTNGKTTTTAMVAKIVRAAGEVDVRVTTVGAWIGDERVDADDQMHEFLHAVEGAVARGARTLALEVTSKALLGGHAKGWPPDVAVFTNLSRDHLDLHGTPEAYLAAKAQLFLALVPGTTAVLAGDDPSSELLREVIADGVRVVRFSVRDPSADLAATRVTVRPRRTLVELAPSPLADALGGRLALSVTGAVHARNALAAALACDALGYPAAAIRAGLEAFEGAPGRFEVVGERPLVVVDYAHTPDGLVGTLETARELAGAGRVLCVFGCGGGRDRGKRAEMGAVASAGADVVVLTTDNPRFERPEDIAAEVRAGRGGAGAWHEELDREAAIGWAVAHAGPDDVVIVAGKGHEAVQELADRVVPFSDVEVARAAVARR